MSLKTTLLSAVLSVSLVSLAACKSETEAKSDVIQEVAIENALETMIEHERRGDDADRDAFRHPKETLEFFGLAPGMSVAEIWPGWYTDILAPYAAMTDGQYTAILYPEGMGERAAKRVAAYKEKYDGKPEYGTLNYGAFGKDSGPILAPNSVDMILTFRNVHNWMGGGYADQAFKEMYAALKPGGTLGVVEHRLPESASQDPQGKTGYVQESYMKALAADAGFEFVASSEVNANPRDTADHPFGVWTLPPRSRTPKADSPEAKDFNAAQYKAIGESDRATLKFRKPK